ncbi:DUF1361 domain-containing protein [Polaribacter batillariae]|uniref:DUF1361 domain-containing protein n=1 Tax=Polaribacter batillariae TaxID=2808900 RepID=A0ABX7SS38_9FLAO|nr:DUF1361 domain-containing protein [Polaribacter batillariae]QTD37052.1 DUF1361 domain-containing protein [Polaribacter batillariae]
MKYLKKISNIHFLILFCLFLFIVRVKLTGSLFFGFLLWNLFLAMVPYLISLKIKRLNFEKITKPKLISLLFIWLIFLPNAPYIITDFIHLHHIKSTLVWLDLFIIFAYASTGLCITILSLFDVYKIIKQKWNLKYANYFSYAVTFLCGFGIYLGRFLRLNSWDIFTNPITVLKKSMYSFNDAKTWLVTFGFGTFIYLLFSIWKTQANAHS